MDKKIVTSNKEVERRENLANPSDDFWFADVSPKTFTGASVTETSAMRFSAFYAAVRIRSQAISTLPLILYKRVGPNKERATNRPLYPILKNSPNKFHTTQEWLEMTSINMDIQGNAYTFVVRNGGGQVEQLMPVHPSRVRIENRVVGIERGEEIIERVYIVEGDPKPWRMSETLHFKDLSVDGVVGISKIKAARQAIAYGLGLEEYGGRFIANDAAAGLVISHPSSIGDVGVKRLTADVEASRRGKNKHRMLVLQEGAKVEKITIPPDDAQFLQSRQFSIQEISRFMGVPPHMLSDLSKSSFNNIEQESLDFLFNTIRPELVKIEQRINKVLLANSEEFFVEFLFDARQRADLASRYEAYSKGLASGFLKLNEVRAWENLPQEKGGDDLRPPLNTAPVEKREYIAPSEIAANEKIVELEKELYKRADTQQPVSLREKYRDDFILASSNLLFDHEETGALTDDKHKVVVRAEIGPLYRTFAGEITGIASMVVGRDFPHIDEFVNKLIDSAVIRWFKAGPAVNVYQAELFADAELIRVHNAVTRAAFIAMGHTDFIWRRGKNCEHCPYCSTLDGEVICGKQEVFVRSGESVSPEGLPPMVVTHNIGHAPLHSGCDCSIEAAPQGEH